MQTPFLRALPIVAKALSENYGVSLEIRGTQARTDGRCIILPVLPEDDQKAAVLARGYLDHESGHVKHTDFACLDGAGLSGNLANILEDIRVEQAMSRRYPGCRENLDALARLLVAEGDFQSLKPSDPPAMLVQGLVLYLLRSRVLGQQALAPLAAQAQAVFDGKFPGLRSQVEAIALEVKDAPDSRTVQDIARRIADLFKDVANPPAAPEPDPQRKGQGNSSPAPSQTGEPQTDATEPDETFGQGGGAASQSDDQQDNEPRETDVGDTDQIGDGTDGDQPLEPQPGEQGSSAPGCDTDGAGQSGDLAAAAAAALADDTSYLDFGQTVAGKLGEMSQAQGGPAMAAEIQPWWSGQPIAGQEMMQATARLRAMLAGVVQAKRARQERPSRFGTRLDLRALPRLAVKDGRVFRSRQERTAVNTAVYLLLDQSGSMGYPKLRVAFLATAALAKGLMAIPGTVVAVGSFCSHYRDGTTRPFVVPLLGFDDGDRRLSLAVPPAVGGTPLAEAIYCVAAKLLRRPEPRKMLFAMTDGEPDDDFRAKEAIAKCRGAGLEVYGVGIMHCGVEPLFGKDSAIVVHNINELPGKLFRLLAQRL